jgi:LCP family protein required for cell wall assembly
MRLKKYLTYFLIFVIVCFMGTGALFSCSKGNGVGNAVPSETTSAESAETTSAEAETTEAEKINYYVSSSKDFTNYSFICPDKWELFEEENGSKVLIKNGADDTTESIFILVESLSDSANIDFNNDAGIEKKYLESADMQSKSTPEKFTVINPEKIKIDGNDANILGYKYQSLLNGDNASKHKSNNTDSIDSVDYFSFVKKDNYLYTIKYIGNNIDTDSAKKTFTDFIATFTFNTGIEKVKQSDSNPSMNILILGDDSAFDRPGGRVNGRTDIIIFFHINLETHKGTIVTIPRDTWVNIPGHGEGKINGAHAFGGNELTVKTIEELSGLNIDNYIITDFDGFKPLIDFLGGVTVEVGENLADPYSGSYLTKGVHHLNGEQALALCRNRHRSGDGTTQGGAFAREKEAAKVIVDLLEQKSTLDKILSLPLFVNFLLNYTWTDLEFMDVLKLIPVLGTIKASDIEITSIPSWPQMIGKASAVVYDKDATAELFEQVKNQ